MVEQRTENPCVPGSIPGGTTQREAQSSEKQQVALFLYPNLYNISTTGRVTAPL